jgi:bacteriocin-like protein
MSKPSIPQELSESEMENVNGGVIPGVSLRPTCDKKVVHKILGIKVWR